MATHKFYLPRGSEIKVNGIPCSVVDSSLVESGCTPEFIFKDAEIPWSPATGKQDGGIQSGGGKARAKKLTKSQRKEIASKAGKASQAKKRAGKV